jgi:phosphoribosylformylglycinamidine cyclo-ligase
MRRTFNLGIGLVALVAPDAADDAIDLLGQHGETAFRIGEVVRGQ